MKPATVVETLDHGNPGLNSIPRLCCSRIAVITLLTYPVSTCTTERSFSSMKRLKTPLRSTMTNVRFSSFAILHIHKHKDVDIDDVIAEFARLKGSSWKWHFRDPKFLSGVKSDRFVNLHATI